MILFREVRLHPTKWSLDVFVAPYKDFDKLGQIMSKRYGAEPSHYTEEMFQGNYVCHVESTDKSEMKGECRIMMQLRSFNPAVIVHESYHVLWRMQHLIKTEVNFDSQEWGAIMMEYLYENITDKKSYQEVKPQLAM